MEYLFDDLKGLLIGAKKECNKRLKSLEDMVNNIISWDYTETSTIEILIMMAMNFIKMSILVSMKVI